MTRYYSTRHRNRKAPTTLPLTSDHALKNHCSFSPINQRESPAVDPKHRLCQNHENILKLTYAQTNPACTPPFTYTYTHADNPANIFIADAVLYAQASHVHEESYFKELHTKGNINTKKSDVHSANLTQQLHTDPQKYMDS